MRKKNQVVSNKIKKAPSRIVFEVFNYTLLGLFAVLCLLPLLHVLFSSVSDPNWLNTNRGLVLSPHGFTMRGYELVFQNNQLIRGIMNSLLYVFLHVVIGLALALTGGYVLAKPNLLLKTPIMLIISFTMLFSGGLIPSYINLRNLHMIDTIWAVVVPGSLSVMHLILIREGFKTVPLSLLESARLDGAGEYRILWSISLPLIKASVATITLYLIIGMWNSWFPAAMYLQNRQLYPMQLIIREILIVNQEASAGSGMYTETADELNRFAQLVRYSTIIVSALPMIVLYPFIMKYFKAGVKVGAVKG